MKTFLILLIFLSFNTVFAQQKETIITGTGSDGKPISKADADAELKVKLLYNELMEAKFGNKPDRARVLYDHIVNEYGETKIGKFVKDRISRDPVIVVGKAVPAFSFASFEDSKKIITNESMRGRVYLIDFWATWCGPCVGEMENLHKAYEKFKGKNFEIISLSFDNQTEDVQNFRRKRWKMPWLHSFIEKGFQSETARQFEVLGIPKPILVDSNGQVIATESDLRGENLEKTLARVLGEVK